MKALKVLAIAGAIAISASAQAQLLNRLKQKAEQKASQKAEQAIDKKLGLNQPSGTGSTGTNGTNSTSNSSSSPANTGGGGLISTPPDVKKNLADAETNYQKLSYSDARYSVQQAMLGVELEIGNKILASLPSSISGLNKMDKEDQVVSSGFGWAGLMILRKYTDSKNKQLTVTIANNSAWMSAINVYFSGAYAQQTGGQQNWKQTKVKGNKAIIEYSDGSGYKVSVPVGQSSLIVYDGVNFKTEQDIISAAETLDIDGIKKQLGEQ